MHACMCVCVRVCMYVQYVCMYVLCAILFVFVWACVHAQSLACELSGVRVTHMTNSLLEHLLFTCLDNWLPTALTAFMANHDSGHT